MSRFFGAGSETDSESSSSEDELHQHRAGLQTKAFVWSDDEEETKRVVRSAKDKRYEEMKIIIKTMRNHKKIKDMSNVLSDFEDLTKAYDKARKVIEKEGGTPIFYTRCLVDLEDFVNECWEDRAGRKAMSKNNAKGLTTVRQKLRKYSRDFEAVIAEYREKPVQDDDELSGGEVEKDSDDDVEKPTPTIATFLKEDAGKDEQDDSDDDDNSSYWDSDSSGSTSSDDGIKYTGQLHADMFLKKVPGEGEERKKKEKKRRKDVKKEELADDDEGWEEVKGGAVQPHMEKAKLFAKDAEINLESVLKKLFEITSSRGKKGTDRSGQLGLLQELRSIAAGKSLGAALDIKILFNIVASVFDYNPNLATCMRPELWEQCLSKLKELVVVLAENSETVICNSEITDETEVLTGDAPYHVRGCVLTMVERMDEEFTKMLQACDAHSTEFVDRLKDEVPVCQIIIDVQSYLQGRGSDDEICRLYLKRISHVYYKFDYVASKRSATEAVDRENDSVFVMERLCKYIYAKDMSNRIRTRAMLCHVYHHALHDRWYQARDLMLMSHLQDTIQYSDIPTQILYNRAMVQLGICAFRQGLIKDAHNCLVDIQSSGRAKELLAQGLLLQRQHERTPEQEKIEKRRQMPYHMHINLELLECVYLVSAMLIEIPYMAAHEFDARRRMISKNFHHVMRLSDKQLLVGPPESMREHVVAASKAMKVGSWQACKDFIINEKMNSKVWDLFYKTDVVRSLLTAKIQQESLRTYLFTYSAIYDSLSIASLAEMFDLKESTVHAIISKMVLNEELMASLDEPTQTVVMHRTEPTRLQALALQLAEKVSILGEYNERTKETKTGGFFFQKQGGQGGYSGGYQQRDRDNRGGYQQRDRDNRGGYQQRDRDNRGGYQQRGDNRGGYQQRDRDNRGGYQQRGDNRGGYQQRDREDRGNRGGYGRGGYGGGVGGRGGGGGGGGGGQQWGGDQQYGRRPRY